MDEYFICNSNQPPFRATSCCKKCSCRGKYGKVFISVFTRPSDLRFCFLLRFSIDDCILSSRAKNA